ncbi:TPA: hypothetical protein DHW62_03475 [candidate division WWE3 bacterium]|uniref:Uncharacterized protein n=1 Tax=candidate division WWE3 bacterium TaxID=2053526 RepID=A0A656PMJ7_UNCKA|nr:hypothetical protein P147_WWE3C00001G0445 [candidate division WWE3 bacterium RAAC2_WWE3_1]KKS29983.1 MAG: hypothetical protein UU91_C0002G0027 [candidate division WWE3 bacterium GW2011_GWB1_42_117]KKS55015.1 MAG: hypothetical protein UV21_C0003G0029 [candidate division WWE3 bacterium GW2011_GWD2_42_34]KKT05583.1 MAG: hypothetical protein UV83_C0002G0027 [candidate division WWE3 bacterium GW2011_GWE2_43_18]KKT07042.1 MAG: hypothetical protein UV84_C0002G0027 [candidate division WWE3 bacterium
MSVLNGETLPVGFSDIDIASRIVKEYKDLFPEDDYVPEIEKCCDANGFSVVINVPKEKYTNFDFAFMVVAGG